MTERSDDVDDQPRISFTDRCDACGKKRRAEKLTSSSLEHTGQWRKNEGENACLKLLKRGIENPIGVVIDILPVMLVHPLLFRGEHVNGCVACPFATAEKGLVVSATRGATALTKSGGVQVRSTKQCMVCAPAFQMRSMMEVEWLWGWLKTNFPAVQQQVKLFSLLVELVELVRFHFDQTLVVYFRYHMQGALSQNIVTNATMHSCNWVLRRVEQELPNVRVIHFQMTSNMSGDITTAAANLLQTRGIHANAKAWIPDEVLRLEFQIDSATLLEYYEFYRNESEAVGVSMHMGEMLTAVFIATGQDVASIGESSSTHLLMAPASREEIDSHGTSICGKTYQVIATPERLQQVELQSGNTARDDSGGGVEPGGVYVSLVLHNLILMTVGGRTGLATQKECLSRMGCYGKESVRRLAEIIAGFALGLALSRLAANVRDHFACTREKPGRSQPDYGLQDGHLNDEFFARVLGSRGRLVEWSTWDLKTGTGILSKLKKQSKKIGHFGFSISYTSGDGSHGKLKVVLKSKPTDIETGNMISDMAQGCRLTLAKIYEMYKMDTGFRYCHIREVELARLDNPILKSFMPAIYHTVNEPAKDVYVMVMEYLTSEYYSLLNTVDDISVWTLSDLKVVLRDLARIHSQYLCKSEWLSSQPWLETKEGRRMIAMAALRQAMVDHARSEFPEMWTEERSKVVYEAINVLPQMWQILDSSPRTMTHNDCSPRNICLRKSPSTVAPGEGTLPSVAVQATPPSHTSCATPLMTPTADSTIGVQFTPYPDPRTLCIYDWELATIDVPQHDLAEFLAFTLQATTPLKTRLELMKFYQQHLQYYSGMEYPWERFVSVFNLSCLDIAMHRLLMYTLVHIHKDCHCHFLPRVVQSHFSYIFDQIAAGNFTPLIKSKL